jgi:Uma2 family endonuclease
MARYVLVAQHEPLIEVYRRNEHGRFELIEARPGELLELSSISATLDVQALYENPLSAQSQS